METQQKDDAVTAEDRDRDRSRDIRNTVHHLDSEVGAIKTRVSVLEERSKAQAQDMKQIHTDIDQNNQLINQVASELQTNRLEDMKERAKAHRWLIVTLIGVVTTLGLMILEMAAG